MAKKVVQGQVVELDFIIITGDTKNRVIYLAN